MGGQDARRAIYIYRDQPLNKIQQHVCTLQHMFFLPRRKPWILSGRCRRWWPGDDFNPRMIGWWNWVCHGLPKWIPHKKEEKPTTISHFFGDVLLFFYPFSAPLLKVTLYPATFQSIPGWNQQLLGSEIQMRRFAQRLKNRAALMQPDLGGSCPSKAFLVFLCISGILMDVYQKDPKGLCLEVFRLAILRGFCLQGSVSRYIPIHYILAFSPISGLLTPYENTHFVWWLTPYWYDDHCFILDVASNHLSSEGFPSTAT